MSLLKSKLEASLGKSIENICPNKFHDLSSNHCAHYVSHMAALEFSYHCREFKGGNKQPGNIRVHETFAQCPLVGKWTNANKSINQLVFVTRKNNVNIPAKDMGNIPQKHIGIYCDGHIYHYSNTPDKVVKWTPKKFLDTFQAVYAGDQGLFFGTFPESDLELAVDLSGTSIASNIAFKLERDSKNWSATALSGSDTNKYFVGREFSKTSAGYHGLFIPGAKYYGPKYNPEDYLNELDHWAYLIDATAFCESASFMNLINTYDRAKFTFGFYQLAAHTPNDNLILLFRELTKLVNAKNYFPELEMRNGKLHRIDEDGGFTNLEQEFKTGPNGARQLQLFMNYLNAKRWEFDEQEVLQAARLMHWTKNDPEFRALQVGVANSILQRKLSRTYHNRYNLHGRSDIICTIIADIHHQGRGSVTTVRNALAAADPREALLSVNNAKWSERNKTLRKKIKALEADGSNKFGKMKYDASNNEFVAK